MFEREYIYIPAYFTVSPYIVSPYTVSPYSASPYIVSPYIVSPYTVSPYIVSPYIVSPYIVRSCHMLDTSAISCWRMLNGAPYYAVASGTTDTKVSTVTVVWVTFV